MKSKKTVMTLACACVLLGCREEKPKEDVSTPVNYMHDKVFMQQLKVHKAKHDELLALHMRLDDELQAEKAKDPSSERVKDLQKKLNDCDLEFERNRRDNYRFVRERLTKKDGGKK